MVLELFFAKYDVHDNHDAECILHIYSATPPLASYTRTNH